MSSNLRKAGPPQLWDSLDFFLNNKCLLIAQSEASTRICKSTKGNVVFTKKKLYINVTGWSDETTHILTLVQHYNRNIIFHSSNSFIMTRLRTSHTLSIYQSNLAQLHSWQWILVTASYDSMVYLLLMSQDTSSEKPYEVAPPN